MRPSARCGSWWSTTTRSSARAWSPCSTGATDSRSSPQAGTVAEAIDAARALRARPRGHGRPPARRLRHRGLPRDPRRAPGDTRRHAHQLPRRGGGAVGDHRRRQRLPAEADPRARPGQRARGGRSRRVAARPGGHREGAGARAADRASGSSTDELADLTAQERKILLLVAEGKTNKEIAAEVFLSDKTVKNYVSSILSKLNLQRRTQAAAFVAKHHLVTGGSLAGAARSRPSSSPSSQRAVPSAAMCSNARSATRPIAPPAARTSRKRSARRGAPRACRRRPGTGGEA